jgi:Na+-translocating ferredoxin:NAD+ oxidoreductase RnfE subunit
MEEKKKLLTPETKRKIWHYIFKVVSFCTACGMPIYAISEHFPMWAVEHGSSRSLGSGVVIAGIVMLVVFKSTVFSWLKEKLQGKHAPPVTIWIVALIVCYILIYINKFLIDLTSILWMGLIGCVIGNAFNYIADHKFGEVKEEDAGRA